MLRYLLPIAVFISLLGCSSKNEKELDLEAVDLVKFEASVKLNRIWSRKAGSGQDNRYTRFSVALDGKGTYTPLAIKAMFSLSRRIRGKKVGPSIPMNQFLAVWVLTQIPYILVPTTALCMP